MSTAVDWPTIGVIVGLGALLWRALGARVDALGVRVDGLATEVREIDRRLTGAVEALAGRVGDVDRRLARLEGWIEGERAGRGGSNVREAPADEGA